MSRVTRSYSQNGVYHILFRDINHQNIFEKQSDCEKLKETILKVKEVSLVIKRILAKYVWW